MPVSSQPSEGHLMSEEVRGSGGIPPQLIKKNFNGSLVFVLADRTFLWTQIKLFLFFVVGAPPPYPGQWEDTRLYFLPK